MNQTNFLNTFDSETETNEPKEAMTIINRPMYRIIILTVGGEVEDVDIQLTSHGRRYARTRARGFHRRIESEEDALAEILTARDNWQAWQRQSERRPDAAFEWRHFANA